MKEPAAATIEFAEHELGGKLLAIVVSQLEGERKPWDERTEQQQEIALNAMRHAVDAAVRVAVQIVASDNREHMLATVESVTFKDGVKAVLSLQKGPGAHDLADAEGSTALVIVGDMTKYTAGTEKVEPAPGQARLPLHQPTKEIAKAPEEAPPAPAPPSVPEVHKLKDGKYEIVIGPAKVHYADSPTSFKSAARAEEWLQKHLEEANAQSLTEAIAAFKAAGKTEGEKPDEERDWDKGFEGIKRKYPADFFEEHYAELSAAWSEGFEEATSDDD